MIGYVLRVLDAIYGVFHRRLLNISLGRRTNVCWSKLNGRGGSIRIGDECILHCRINFDHPLGCVEVGDRCFIGSSLLVCHTSIKISNDVIISWGVTIVDHDSHSVLPEHRIRDVVDWADGRKDWSQVRIAPVTIDDQVWIGFGASILKGVHIGRGAVIAAQSVVTRDVPSGAVVAGNPARIVRYHSDDFAKELTKIQAKET